jgi:hypothetical protein
MDFFQQSFHRFRQLGCYELSAVTGHSLRFKYRATFHLKSVAFQNASPRPKADFSSTSALRRSH